MLTCMLSLKLRYMGQKYLNKLNIILEIVLTTLMIKCYGGDSNIIVKLNYGMSLKHILLS